jgi:hypothetical protein
MQNLHQIIEVQAAADHLSSVANAGVRTALAELIWNSVDADATEVDVNFIRNELDTVEKIEVRDNGTGMPRERAEQSFGAIGGSWKKHAVYSTKERRQLHGRNGKGRLTAFSIGQKVTWLSRFFTAEGMHSFETFGVYDNLRSINISAVTKVLAASTGTIVKITALSDKATQNLGSTEKLVEWVATEFSSYLRSYPHIVITIDGMRVDPSIVEDHVYETELPPVELNDGKVYPAKLRIVEWLSKGERKLCLCDAGGFTVGSIDTGIRPGAEFSYTAYLCSDYFRELEAENAIDLGAMDWHANHLIDQARSRMRSYFRGRKANLASDWVAEWKQRGIYPYKANARDTVDETQRQVFDICALTVAEYLDSFRKGDDENKRFVLEMLKLAVQDNPAALKNILEKVLKLPREKQEEMSDLLDKSSLDNIIEAGALITERLDFLAGLKALLFEKGSKEELLERSQLHKILENETWIFGEEYHLSHSDEGLTTILRSEMKLLRDDGNTTEIDAELQVLRDDGTKAVIDLMLAREVPQNFNGKRDFLVVELKRPNKKIDLKVKGQIESYALTVSDREEFDKLNTRWTFLAVSNEITPQAEATINQSGLQQGYFYDSNNVRIGLASWGTIIQQCQTRYELYRKRLNYQATRSEGVKALRKRYEKYLPAALLDDEVIEL